MIANNSNNRTSNLVASSLPFFIRGDHGTFVRFLEAYYQYTEQYGKVTHRTKNVQTLRKIDLTEDDFADKLYSEFLKYIPENALVDRRLLIKHIKDFYRAKGSEKATRFLMRILYNTEIDIYYPKKDVLRVSDGKWFIQKSLRIGDTKIDAVANTNLTGLEKYIGTQISGASSNTTALVERIDRFYEQGSQIDELILSNINGSFTAGELIESIFNDGGSTRDITSNILSGIISSISVVNQGTNYSVGDPVIIVSSTGSGACVSVASVTTGNISAIVINSGGAGFKVGNDLVFSGGGGTLADGMVSQVLLDETIHPNSYNLVASTISLEANTQLGNTQYSNLNHSTVNTTIANAVSYWSYSNTGPISAVVLSNVGMDYISPPDIAVSANTLVYQMGILGRMEIISGGQNYRAGDTIEFINQAGGYGSGALGNVITVGASNTITGIRFKQVAGQLVGGSGYDQLLLPRANVVTSTGNGANIIVRSILGAGANLTASTSSIGAIQRLIIYNKGVGYTTNTRADLTQSGDGLATATLSIVEGLYSYPGRYLNDDGHISSYNFLQDRDYYQNFSYVIRSNKPISDYRQIVKDTIHPAGTKLFGEYLYVNEDTSICSANANNSIKTIILPKTYSKLGNTVNIAYVSHSLSPNTEITLEFLSGGASNVKNGIYKVSESANTNHFKVIHTAYYRANTANITITGNVLVGVITDLLTTTAASSANAASSGSMDFTYTTQSGLVAIITGI